MANRSDLTYRMALSLSSALVVLGFLLTACTSLPKEAERSVLAIFDEEEQAQLHTAHQATLLAEDVASGFTEIWCVNIEHLCYDCARQELKTCLSSYLVRQTSDGWSAIVVLDEAGWAGWEARGCPTTGESRP